MPDFPLFYSIIYMDSISVFDIIKVGIGPSSSHTMGPWKASEIFAARLAHPEQVSRIQLMFFGSLAKTGAGHGTDIGALMGLMGEDYTTTDTGRIHEKIETVTQAQKLPLGGKYQITFIRERDVLFCMKESLPFHPNGMRIIAYYTDGKQQAEEFFSVGGGFVVQENSQYKEDKLPPSVYPCHDANSILNYCSEMQLNVSELVMINEATWRSKEDIRKQCLYLWKEIKECIYRGINKKGILPGGLNVKRRAADINEHLIGEQQHASLEEWIELVKKAPNDFNSVNKWVSCFALAVNEENASFGRIVTAPTNGAAGVIPAVLMYGYCFAGFDEEKIIRFILTAGEIGTLYKKKATISAAMGGCQAEIGVSSSMAAAGLTEALGGSPGQVLMAGEIAMEHHLGLTCDPIGGLVQIPCIERNAMGAMKAITASNIAFESDYHAARVSMDAVIQSMWETAQDMNGKYKETSEGGLASNVPVNIAEC